MGSPALTQTLASRVDGLLTQLVKQGHANMQTYVLVAAVHAQDYKDPCTKRKDVVQKRMKGAHAAPKYEDLLSC
eukprot:1161813-Pelagomonas_calceolata.AAC.1